MKIYLIRHSNAVDPGTPGYEDDSLRPLTEKGRDRVSRLTPGDDASSGGAAAYSAAVSHQRVGIVPI